MRNDPDVYPPEALRAKLFAEQLLPQVAALSGPVTRGAAGLYAIPEAHLVKALDKAETILQHNQGKNPPDFDYAFNLTYGASYFKGDPRLEELRSILDAETNVVIEHTQEKENHHL